MDARLRIVFATLVRFPFCVKPQPSYAYTTRKVKCADKVVDSLGLTRSQFVIRLKELEKLGYISLKCNINDVTTLNKFSYQILKTQLAASYIN